MTSGHTFTMLRTSLTITFVFSERTFPKTADAKDASIQRSEKTTFPLRVTISKVSEKIQVFQVYLPLSQ